MHIETLKIFLDLAQIRSFSKTAEKHLLSQSAVSQQLAQLELTHKCQLVNRKKRPIELTKAGQVLYEACKDILDRYEHLRNELNTLRATADVKINIAAIFSIGMHALPDYVKKFMARFPKVNVHIEYFSAEKIYESVLSGDIDIGIVAVPKKDKRLDVYEFENEPLVLVCSPRHPLAGQQRIDIHKVQFENFIAFEKDLPSRMWIDNCLRSYNIYIHPLMEFDNIETIKRAVEINSGISILPKNAVIQEVSAGSIKSIEISNADFLRPTGILVRKNKVLGQAGRYFIELLTGASGK